MDDRETEADIETVTDAADTIANRLDPAVYAALRQRIDEGQS